MASQRNSVAVVDGRSFFERALDYGVEQGVLTDAHVDRIRQDGPKGIVQIANHFGTAYLQASLETAAARMVNLVSLYLEDQSDTNLQVAAALLRENSFLSHSRGGSDMLKRLNALPRDSQLAKRQANAAEEKSFVDERSYALPFSLSEYRKELAQRLEMQRTTDFARWLAVQLQAKADDYADHQAEEVINAAMLVCYVGQEPLALPTRSGFVKLVEQLRKPAFKPKAAPLDRLPPTAPDEFRRLAAASMQAFIKDQLPKLKSSANKPVDFIHGDLAGLFFVRESLEEEVGEFDQMVAKEWVRITKGRTDPATIATIFLFIATGQPPKPTALLKEARSIVSRFRINGFDSDAVCRFIDEHAPTEQQNELRSMWLDDLKPEAEIHLADPDADDTYMDRALPYLKNTCAASWKGRG